MPITDKKKRIQKQINIYLAFILEHHIKNATVLHLNCVNV